MRTAAELADALGVNRGRVAAVGSKLICGAGNDYDFLALLDDEKTGPVKLGFEPDLETQLYDSVFTSWRKDDVNLLVTTDPSYYASEVTIAWAAALTNLQSFNFNTREGRVAFHSKLRNCVRPYVLREGMFE